MAISYEDARERLAVVLEGASITFEGETVAVTAVQREPDMAVAEWPVFVMHDLGHPNPDVRHGGARKVTHRLMAVLILGERDVPSANQMVRLFDSQLVTLMDSEILLNDANGPTCTECRGPATEGAGIVEVGGRQYVGAEFVFEIDIQAAVTFSI